VRLQHAVGVVLRIPVGQHPWPAHTSSRGASQSLGHQRRSAQRVSENALDALQRPTQLRTLALAILHGVDDAREPVDPVRTHDLAWPARTALRRAAAHALLHVVDEGGGAADLLRAASGGLAFALLRMLRGRVECGGDCAAFVEYEPHGLSLARTVDLVVENFRVLPERRLLLEVLSDPLLEDLPCVVQRGDASSRLRGVLDEVRQHTNRIEPLSAEVHAVDGARYRLHDPLKPHLVEPSQVGFVLLPGPIYDTHPRHAGENRVPELWPPAMRSRQRGIRLQA